MFRNMIGSRLIIGAVAFATFMSVSVTGCDWGWDESLDNVVDAIESTRATIGAESTAWRDQLAMLPNTINGMESHISKDAKEVVTTTTNQIRTMADQTIAQTDGVVQNLMAQAGVEFRCNGDYVKTSVSDELEYFVDDLKFWKTNHRALDAQPKHSMCWIAPSVLSLYPTGNGWSVDTSTMPDKGVVHLYGYNFRSDAMPRVELQDIRGEVVRSAMIKPAFVTRYQMDLDVSSETFADVAPGSRLVLVWPDKGEPSTISLTLHPAAALRLSNPVFTSSEPTAGKDAVGLSVTVTNTGGQQSQPVIVTWTPDPNDKTTFSKSLGPISPGEDPKVVKFDTYVYLRDGQIQSNISLSNGDDRLTPTVQVKPAPREPAPERNLDGFPKTVTKYGKYIGGTGEDDVFGGPCDPGYVRGRKEITVIDSSGSESATADVKDWTSADPTECQFTVHFSIRAGGDAKNFVKVSVLLTEQGI